MKILHIVSGELSGGAARGAYWLHQELVLKGIDSILLSNSINTFGDNTVIRLMDSKWYELINAVNKKLYKFPRLLYKNKQHIQFSSGMIGFDFRKLSIFPEIDILHLHWINDAFINIKYFENLKVPIVWTLRDMWPMTGGCHYSEKCLNFIQGCGKCPLLNSSRDNDLSTYISNRKIKYFPKDTKIIGISSWISNLAKKSKIFHDFDVRTISNNIKLAEFYPVNTEAAKNKLGISTNKNIILVGAIDFSSPWKGFDKFLEALNYLDNENYFLCFFGKIEEYKVDKLGFDWKNFGLLEDNSFLRDLYSLATIFVSPSTYETFGKTIAEAMACGTPAVCFDDTGSKDIITHKVDGYKAVAYKPIDLATGIEWLVKSENYLEICMNARIKVQNRFNSSVIAEKYIQLYKEITSPKY